MFGFAHPYKGVLSPRLFALILLQCLAQVDWHQLSAFLELVNVIIKSSIYILNAFLIYVEQEWVKEPLPVCIQISGI